MPPCLIVRSGNLRVVRNRNFAEHDGVSVALGSGEVCDDIRLVIASCRFAISEETVRSNRRCRGPTIRIESSFLMWIRAGDFISTRPSSMHRPESRKKIIKEPAKTVRAIPKGWFEK